MFPGYANCNAYHTASESNSDVHDDAYSYVHTHCYFNACYANANTHSKASTSSTASTHASTAPVTYAYEGEPHCFAHKSDL